MFELEATRIRSILGERIRALEHVGSTAVPGLAAKPIIDMILAVANSADEVAHVPPMEARGYFLRIREPDWLEHRLFKGPDRAVNLHVFNEGLPEIDPMLMFRDWLRVHDDDRSCTSARSASWPPATGRTCRTTPTPRPRSSRQSLGGRFRRRGHQRARVDIEHGVGYRPRTHMNCYFYFRCPA